MAVWKRTTQGTATPCTVPAACQCAPLAAPQPVSSARPPSAAIANTARVDIFNAPTPSCAESVRRWGRGRIPGSCHPANGYGGSMTDDTPAPDVIDDKSTDVLAEDEV